MTKKEKIGAYAAWAAVCFFWGTTYLAIRIGLETMPPMLFAGLRFLTAGTILLCFVSRFQRGAWLPQGREWVDLAVVGLMLLGIGTGVVVWAEQWVPSGLAALLVATSPFWVALLDRFRPEGEHTSRRAVLGMIIGFAGLVVLVAPDLLQANLSGAYLLGIVALQIGCASWSAGSVYAKQHPTNVAPLVGAAIQMLVAGVALTLIGTIRGEWPLVHFNARTLGAFVYLVLFGSIVAYGSYLYALQKLPLSLISTYSYINPVIAVLLGWLLLSEPLGWRVVLGAAIILGGVALVKTAPKKIRLPKSQKRLAQQSESDLIHHTTSPQICTATVD